EIEFTSIGSLVDDTAPAIFGLGVGWTRKVRSPRRLTSGVSAVRTLTAGAQALSASSTAVVRSCVVRIVFSWFGKSWSPPGLCTHHARRGAWRMGGKVIVELRVCSSRTTDGAATARSRVMNIKQKCTQIDRLVESP